jgi:hypothetical protein
MKKIDILYYLTGLTIIVSFLWTEYAIIFIEIPESNRDMFIHLIGIIEGSFVGGLVGYFFVSSRKVPSNGSTPN